MEAADFKVRRAAMEAFVDLKDVFFCLGGRGGGRGVNFRAASFRHKGTGAEHRPVSF